MITDFYPSPIFEGHLPRAGALNRELNREIEILSKIDGEGRRWSAKNYRGGYSSYASMTKLHKTSPHFEELATRIEPYLRRYATFANSNGISWAEIDQDDDVLGKSHEPRHASHDASASPLCCERRLFRRLPARFKSL